MNKKSLILCIFVILLVFISCNFVRNFYSYANRYEHTFNCLRYGGAEIVLFKIESKKTVCFMGENKMRIFNKAFKNGHFESETDLNFDYGSYGGLIKASNGIEFDVVVSIGVLNNHRVGLLFRDTEYKTYIIDLPDDIISAILNP